MGPTDAADPNLASAPCADRMALRQRAEALWQVRAAQTVPAEPAASAEAARRLLRELQVHQIELEMQSDELQRTQRDLAAARDRYFALYDLAPVGYLTLNERGGVAHANLAAATLLARPRAGLIGLAIGSLIHPADQDAYYLNRRQLLKTGQVAQWEMRLRTPNDDTRWVQVAASLAPVAEGAAPWLLLVLSDISARRQVEGALRRSEARFRRIMESDLIGLIFWDGGGRILQANDAFLRMVGYSRTELQAGKLNWAAMTPPEYRELDAAALIEVTLRGSCRPYEKEYLRRDGTRLPILIGGASFTEQPGEGVAFVLDISERRRADAAVQRLLHDKDALLKEVHHRVNNNLQVISSLLRLETGRSGLPAVQLVLRAMQARVLSMALLHETLVRSDSIAAVDLGRYLRQLATQAFQASAVDAGAVRLQLDLASAQVGMDQAIPCGLLVNELIANGLQHAFPDGLAGTLRVELQSVDDGRRLRLCVSDDGVGLPADLDTRDSQSLGLPLVADLAQQLDASLRFGAGHGTAVELIFTPKPAQPAADSDRPTPQETAP